MTRLQAFNILDAGANRKDLGLGKVIEYLHDECPAEYDRIAQAMAAAQDRLATRILHFNRLEEEADKQQQSINFDEETKQGRNRRNIKVKDRSDSTV